MTDARPKRIQRFGPGVQDRRGGVDRSLWDLWFCVVAVRDHDGDLDALAGDVGLDGWDLVPGPAPEGMRQQVDPPRPRRASPPGARCPSGRRRLV